MTETPGAPPAPARAEAAPKPPLAGLFGAPPLAVFLTYTVAYALLALLGLMWSTTHGAASPVWPAAGLGLVAVRLGGPGFALPVLPATFVMAMLARGDATAAAELALANVVAALVGAAALPRAHTDALRVRTLRDVGRLLRAGAIGATGGAATGVGALYVAGGTAHLDVAWAAAMWWVGDFLGVLLVAPALCAWLEPDPEPEGEAPAVWPTRLAALSVLGVAVAVFLPIGPWSQIWLVYPPLLWLTMSGRMRHLTAVLSLVTVIAVLGTTLRHGPFGPMTRHTAVLELQVFLGVTILVVYLLAAALAERRRVAADLALRTRALEASVADLEAFAYTASHDLRRPLRSVHAFAECVLEDHGDQLPEEARADLTRITQAAERMSELIEALLAFSRLQGRTLHWQPCDLAELARDVVAGLRAAEPHRRVEVELPERLPTHGDPALLRIALENLLGNAWKYSARVPAPRIEFGRRGTDEPATYFVRDNGAGFDLENAPLLFRPFQRFHDPKAFEGTGIGLATVARIVDRHGGRVRAESAPGAGATFWFTLPGARPPRT
jgi:signal transduction histidine kinase